MNYYFNQFSKIIESFNGRIVSLENPHYIKANLKLEEDCIDNLIKQNGNFARIIKGNMLKYVKTVEFFLE